ncbi:MAG: sugar phosphate nucleotidyltransferase [Planctomycetota bacterium]
MPRRVCLSVNPYAPVGQHVRAVQIPKTSRPRRATMSRFRSTWSAPGPEGGAFGPQSGRPDCRWVVVLAGGSGARLKSLTSGLGGRSVPKQYCSFLGGQSLLLDTMARAQKLASRRRVVTVVARQHEQFWHRDLRDRSPDNVIVQPQNRGTAAGILLPLLAILARDAGAQVTLMPSDHFIADEPILMESLRAAQRSASKTPRRVLLVGIRPDSPEGDYGWILPGEAADTVHEVRRFVEKPDRQVALDLLQAGAVWNSFLVVGSARAILQLYAQRLPNLLATFREAEVDRHPANGDRLYEGLRDADFCRDVLAGAEASLGLCIAPTCGWTDLGTPTRVAQCASQLRSPGAVQSGSLAAAVSARFLNGPPAQMATVNARTSPSAVDFPQQ